MKAIFFLLLSFFSFCQINLNAQKFRTLEQFQNYFIENESTIDAIEGIWYVYQTIYGDNRYMYQLKFTVAIIKESDSYSQYTIEDGYYKPSSGYKKFNKNYTSYTCIEYKDQCNLTFKSDQFYIINNKFSYNYDITPFTNCMANRKLSINVENKSSYSKIYPLSSDIIEKKEENKIQKSTGTGFAISPDGYIVTNYHVIENALSIKVKGVGGSFSKSYSAKVIISDKNNDLSIIKIDDLSINLGVLPYVIKLTTLNVGENIFVLGYPLTATMGEEIKLTNGIISSKSGFQGDITSYQMTAPIQPGNSGAPMFDKDGNIAGIVNAKHRDAENANYAIKSNYLLNLTDALPIKINLPTLNTIKVKQLPDQVSIVKGFIYLIEIN